MDIYQCMTCGQQWPHGSLEMFRASAGHADETRGQSEGMHYVMVGERMQLEALYAAHQAGEPLIAPNDHKQIYPSAAPSLPEPPPATLSALARRLGVTEEQARDLVRALFEPPEEPLPDSALDDIVPVGGQLLRWEPQTDKEPSSSAT